MNKNVEKAAIALKVGDEKGWTAAEALWKANKEDGLTQPQISAALTDALGPGYSQPTIARYVKVWERFGNYSARNNRSFTDAYMEVRHKGDGREGIANREARKVVHERPEVIAEAISNAPREVQARIAESLVKAPETEQSLRRVAEGPKPAPRISERPEQKLGKAVFLLWEVSQLILEHDPVGEEKVRMLGSVEAARKVVEALSSLLDTGTLDAEFKQLLAEMNA